MQRQRRDGLAVLKDGEPTGMLVQIKPSSQDAYVRCTIHEGGCQRTRTLRQGRARNGRPFGQLAAWAAMGSTFPSKEAHMGFQPDRAARRAARDDLKLDLSYAEFAAHEHPKIAGEDSEPA